MPELLHLTEGIEYGLSLRRVRIVVLQALHVHARVDPRKRTAELPIFCLNFRVYRVAQTYLTQRIGVPDGSMTTARNGLCVRKI